MSLSMSKALVASASPRPASRNARSSPASSTSSRWRKNEATATDRCDGRGGTNRGRARASLPPRTPELTRVPSLLFRSAEPLARKVQARKAGAFPRAIYRLMIYPQNDRGPPADDALFPLPLFLLLSPSLRSRLQGDRREGAGAHQGGPLRRGRLPRRAGAPRARRGARAIRTPDPARLRSFCSSTLARERSILFFFFRGAPRSLLPRRSPLALASPLTNAFLLQVDERLNGDGTGLILGLNDELLGFVLLTIPTLIFSQFYAAQKDEGIEAGGKNDDSGLSL